MGRPASPWYRKDKRCWYVTLGGRQRRLSPNKAEAHRLWAELLATETPSPSPRVADLPACDKWWFASFLDMFGDRAVATIPTADILAWLAARATWSQNTRWRVATDLRVWLRACGFPRDDLRTSRGKPRGPDCMPTPEQHAALLGLLREPHRTALTLLWLTGCRPGEICGLRRSHYRDGSLWLTSKGRARVVVLSPLARAIVERLVSLATEDRVWPRLSARNLGTRVWDVKRRRPDLRRVLVYGYRHAYATDALAAGLPDALVAELLGHCDASQIHTTYGHVGVRRDAVRRAAAMVESARDCAFGVPEASGDIPGG